MFRTKCRLRFWIAVPAVMFSAVVLGASQPLSKPKPRTVHRETLDQPPAPPRGTPRFSVPRAPAGSVQVNVNALGQNIAGDAANEPSIVVDPTNANRIAIGWRQFDSISSNFRQGGWAYSTDGGQTWTFPGVLEAGVFRSDPILRADGFGNFYYNSLQSTFCMDVFRSTNGGMTWPTKVAAFGGDKAWMGIDRRTSGQGAGHIYCAWSRAATCTGTNTFTRSTDGGATWMTPIAIPNTPTFGTIAVGPDGELYVAGVNAPSFSNSTFVVARSNNAKDPSVTPTWVSSVTGNFLGGALTGSAGPNPGGLLGQVWIAVNPTSGPSRGHVYLLASVDPAGADPLDVKFSRSTDGGLTWSSPVRVNGDPTNNGAFQWFGTMSVAPDGRLDVVWADTRDDPTNLLSRVYYSFSTDEGATWSTNLAVTPQFDSHVGFPSQNKIGDYYDMESDALGAHLAYSATFNGEQDVYYMRILANDCNRNGTPDDEDILLGTSQDCNANGLPDECENDCNGNGIADECDLSSGTSQDCNHTGIPDDCEPGHEDCNNNTILDQCETFVDCNGNGHLDSCDIASQQSGDCNGNGVPDDCEVPSGVAAADACASAKLITPGLSYSGRTTLLTNTDGSAACASTGRDVYYRYKPVVSGTLTASLCAGTGFDTVLSIHSGCPATSGNQLAGACNDDGCSPGGPSIISGVSVTAGAEYLIRISGFDNGGAGGDTGDFTLTLTGPVGVGDCDNNGVPDECQIAAGGDADGDGLPDICEPFPVCGTCAGDMNGSSAVRGDDVQKFVACLLAFPTVTPDCACADLNADHQITAADAGLLANKLLTDGPCP